MSHPLDGLLSDLKGEERDREKEEETVEVLRQKILTLLEENTKLKELLLQKSGKQPKEKSSSSPSDGTFPILSNSFLFFILLFFSLCFHPNIFTVRSKGGDKRTNIRRR